jgi:hypothetical protein
MDHADYNLIALAVVAFCNMIPAVLAAIFAWRAHVTTLATQANVAKVETATNSMKDALVAATRAEAHAAGMEEGRLAGVAKAATLAEGRRQGEANPLPNKET